MSLRSIHVGPAGALVGQLQDGGYTLLTLPPGWDVHTPKPYSKYVHDLIDQWLTEEGYHHQRDQAGNHGATWIHTPDVILFPCQAGVSLARCDEGQTDFLLADPNFFDKLRVALGTAP